MSCFRTGFLVVLTILVSVAQGDNLPARAEGNRPNMYDHSLRVPLAIRYPGKIKQGTTIPETVTNLDWFPTLLELAGIKMPTHANIRGRSFVPLLEGRGAGWNNDLYAEYSTHHQTRTQMRMFRTPEWKLIRDFFNPERDELYHLHDDPSESTNRIDEKSEEVEKIVQQLHARILAKMKEIGDPVWTAGGTP